MKNQSGYINLDGLFTDLLVIGAVIGVVLAVGGPWLWSLIKPLLHALTA